MNIKYTKQKGLNCVIFNDNGHQLRYEVEEFTLEELKKKYEALKNRLSLHSFIAKTLQIQYETHQMRKLGKLYFNGEMLLATDLKDIASGLPDENYMNTRLLIGNSYYYPKELTRLVNIHV